MPQKPEINRVKAIKIIRNSQKNAKQVGWEMLEKTFGEIKKGKSLSVARVLDWDKLGHDLIGTRHMRLNQGLSLPRRMVWIICLGDRLRKEKSRAKNQGKCLIPVGSAVNLFCLVAD
ncbi:hypothetical protein [Paenibacillus solanacearum]|uniref:hypothetical protein n=1 Tax=Paenibacillus solanacearum TaxID=2048548 RepID=UPI001C405949|nr:hypothetical protein [Paenibacillus solanacearum]